MKLWSFDLSAKLLSQAKSFFLLSGTDGHRTLVTDQIRSDQIRLERQRHSSSVTDFACYLDRHNIVSVYMYTVADQIAVTSATKPHAVTQRPPAT